MKENRERGKKRDKRERTSTDKKFRCMSEKPRLVTSPVLICPGTPGGKRFPGAVKHGG